VCGVYRTSGAFGQALHWPGIIPKSAINLPRRSSTATWWPLLMRRHRSEAGQTHVCAMGQNGCGIPVDGLPPQSFLIQLDPLFNGIRNKLGGEYLTSEFTCPGISPRSGPRSLVWGRHSRVPVEHSTHTGTNWRGLSGETSSTWLAPPPASCHEQETQLIPGVCGVVRAASIPPISQHEAGSRQLAIFEAIAASRAGVKVPSCPRAWKRNRAGQSGLLRLTGTTATEPCWSLGMVV